MLSVQVFLVIGFLAVVIGCVAIMIGMVRDELHWRKQRLNRQREK